MWLASWNSRLFCPAKNTGATGAALADQPRGEVLPFRVDGALVPDRRRGRNAACWKHDKTAALHQMRLASARVLRLVCRASSVSAKSTGSRNVLTSSARQSTALVSTRKSLRTCDTSWQMISPSSTPNGWLATTTSGPFSARSPAPPRCSRASVPVAGPRHRRNSRPAPDGRGCPHRSISDRAGPSSARSARMRNRFSRGSSGAA